MQVQNDKFIDTAALSKQNLNNYLNIQIKVPKAKISLPQLKRVPMDPGIEYQWWV